MPDLPELVLESRTQSAETIEKIMDNLGYESVETSEQTDAAPPKPAPETPPAAETSSSPTPPAAPGEEVPAGGEVEDEAGHETPPGAGGGTAHKRKGGFARKLDAQASVIDSLKAQLEEVSRKLAGSPAGQPGGAPPAPATVAAPKPDEAVEDPEPTIEQFQEEDDAYAAWVKAQARWSVRDERRQEAKREKEKRANEESARQSQADESTRQAAEVEQNAIAERWSSNAEHARANHPDFDDVLKTPFDPAKPRGNPVMANMANDYDQVAELVYYLFTHPDEATFIESQTRLPENFVQLGPRARQRAIRVAEDAAKEAFDQILPKLAAPSPAPAPGTAGRRETPAAAAPPPSSPATPPRAKQEAPKPVGNRGGAVTKRYEDMTAAEQRALPIEEVRRLRGMTTA